MTAAPNLNTDPQPSLQGHDRETFFQAQARNRRATWRMSFLCVVAVLVMGVPLTLVLTPLVYAASLFIAEIVNLISPLPRDFWTQSESLVKLCLSVPDHFFNHAPLDTGAVILGSAGLLLPGMLLALLLWIGVRALFHRAGVGGILLSLSAREPNRADLKELQLADVVEEMAIAAGLPAPRVMLVDADAANVAAIGTSPADAHIVVTRPLIDGLNRDELQGALAHVIASVGNGDLAIAFTVASVFETCGLLLTLINAPFGAHARGTLWRVLRYSFRRRSTTDAAEAEAVSALLMQNVGLATDDIDHFFDDRHGRKSIFRSAMRLILLPFFFTNAAIKLTLWAFTSALLGPCIALLWRTRHYLADASAVQFTRYPDGLAGALSKLGGGEAIPGAAWASHLFIVGLGRSETQLKPTSDQMQQAMSVWRAMGGEATQGVSANVANDVATFRADIVSTQRAALRGDAAAIARLTMYGRAIAAERASSRAGAPDTSQIASGGLESESFVSFHPPIAKRLKRLQRMGAHVAELGKKRSPAIIVFTTLLWILIGPLLALAGALILVVIAMMTMLNLVFLGFWLAAIHAIFSLFGPG